MASADLKSSKYFTTIFVTGATGFVGSHVIKAFLESDSHKKYHICASMRKSTISDSESKSVDIEFELRSLFTKEQNLRLTIFFLDLVKSSQDDWERAFEQALTRVTVSESNTPGKFGPPGSINRNDSCLIHVASPFPLSAPDNVEQELLQPAIEGTKKVITAAYNTGIRRCVVTASTTTIGNNVGNYPNTHVFNEKDSVDADECKSAYSASKIRAENAAWELKENDQFPDLQLVTIHPSYILGPMLINRNATSHAMNLRFLTGQFSMGMVPCLGVNCCDVRDVAKVHLKAAEYLLNDENKQDDESDHIDNDVLMKTASSQESDDKVNLNVSKRTRFIVSSGNIWMTEIRDLLLQAAIEGDFEPYIKKGTTGKLPKRTAPGWLLDVVGLFDETVRTVKCGWMVKSEYDCSKTEKVLGLKIEEFKSVEECVLENAKSLVAKGFIK